MLGSMEKFVPEGSTVGLLINSDFEDKGVYVNPDISIAVIKMCFDAGAKDVVFIQTVQEEYWKCSSIYEQYKDMIHKCINTRASNVHMHIGGKTRTDLDWFAQCIADLHLVKKTDLCIVDATEFIITNGPSCPGEIRKLDKVVAGTDIVAIDAYCAGLLDYSIDDVLAIDKAYKHGLGEKDLSKVNIVEYSY